MITELSIEGFKSFGSPEQKLALGPLNFVVGANASGKSNLLAALRFLRDAVTQDAEYAVAEHGGIAEVHNKILTERKPATPCMFAFTIEPKELSVSSEGKRLRFNSFSYSLSLDLSNGYGKPEVLAEELLSEISDERGQLQKFVLHRNKSEIEISDPTAGESRQFQTKVPEQEATRLALGVGFFSLPCVVLRDLVANWKFYHIHPLAARKPSKEMPEVELGPAGENLAVILHKLEQQNGKAAIESIVSGLKSVVLGFQGIKTTQLPIEGEWAFQILEEGIRGAINPSSVSDGTIRLLAFMVIANWTSKHSSLVAIEEPENGIHPHLSEHLVGILRQAAKDQQIVVTSHNPAFLDHLQPEEIILCDKVEGFTSLRRASDIPEIKDFQKRFRLGDLWVQGVLGGIP